MSDASQSTRCEIADLYFWLGSEAEVVGFTPWQIGFLGSLPQCTPICMIDDRLYRKNDQGRWEHADGN